VGFSVDVVAEESVVTIVTDDVECLPLYFYYVFQGTQEGSMATADNQ